MGFTLQFNANAVKTAASTHFLFKTGSVPGVEQSNNDTFAFTGLANSFGDLENNFDLVAICACISKPTTLRHCSLLE